MKYSNQIEIIFFARYYLEHRLQKELVWWLGTAAQLLIGQQQAKAEEVYLGSLKEAPIIYMS